MLMTHCGRDDLFCLFERLRVSLLSGSFDSSILLEVKPPTGEPYAGDPPVRFGGRGSCGSPYPYPSQWPRDATSSSHSKGRRQVIQKLTQAQDGFSPISARPQTRRLSVR